MSVGFRHKKRHSYKFGIHPIPKKDEQQENYISYCKAIHTSVIFVSKTAKDSEMSAYLIEAMAALSEKHLEHAYYDKLLKGRSADSIDGLIVNDAEGLASTYKASIRMANMEKDEMIDAIVNAK